MLPDRPAISAICRKKIFPARIILFLGLIAACYGNPPLWVSAQSTSVIAPEHDVALRLASAKQPAEEWTKAQMSDDQTIFLAPEKLATAAEFAKVTTIFDETGRPAVSILLSESAGEKMKAATANSDDERCIAIVVDDRPVLVLPIRGQLDRKLQINGSFTQQEINRLYSKITGR